MVAVVRYEEGEEIVYVGLRSRARSLVDVVACEGCGPRQTVSYVKWPVRCTHSLLVIQVRYLTQFRHSLEVVY